MKSTTTTAESVTANPGATDCSVVPPCGHSDFVKCGKDRNKKQRYRCRVCSRRFSDTTNKPGYRLGVVKESQIEKLLDAGVSTRKVAAIVGVSKDTVMTRAIERTPIEDLHEPKGPAENRCHYCGSQIGPREYDRRTARTKHAFCDQKCYIRFYLVTDAGRLTKYLQRKLKHG